MEVRVRSHDEMKSVRPVNSGISLIYHLI